MTPENLGAARAFVDIATQYCDFILRVDNREGADVLLEAERLLPALYIAALDLPDTQSSDGPWPEGITHERWRVVFLSLRSSLGVYDRYREIYDPAAMADPSGAIENGDAPVEASLADDLADIWRDLQAGVRVWPGADEGKRRDLTGYWQESFSSHWGQHLVDALRAIHWWRHVHHAGAVDRDPAV
jgi:hypothetical protein